jgi:hypothetical protein
VLGHKQAKALMDAALRGIEDMIDLGDHDEARSADSALDALARAMNEAGVVYVDA